MSLQECRTEDIRLHTCRFPKYPLGGGGKGALGSSYGLGFTHTRDLSIDRSILACAVTAQAVRWIDFSEGRRPAPEGFRKEIWPSSAPMANRLCGGYRRPETFGGWPAALAEIYPTHCLSADCSLSLSEAAEFRISSRFPIDAILVDSGLRDYEINLDLRFSTEPAHPPANRPFICKTGTEQHTTGPADFLKNSGKNRPALHGHKTEINSSWMDWVWARANTPITTIYCWLADLQMLLRISRDLLIAGSHVTCGGNLPVVFFTLRLYR
jgi:hypothetical protein